MDRSTGHPAGGPAPASPAPPEDFDWQEYLRRYPDLRAAGIDSEQGARDHWMKYGKAEGRWGAPLTRPGRMTLSCPTVASIYLRATGDLVCWDDAGNEMVLQPWSREVHYGRQVWLGEPYEKVRRALWEGRMPFPWVCQRCLVLQAYAPHSSEPVDRRRMEVFQVEPSYYCSLDCPGCISRAARRLARPSNLDPAVLEKIIGDFAEAGIEVRAFDFQGHGEPLLNRRIWALVRMAREAYPRSFISMTTNAHGLVTPEALGSGIDEVVCAIDGASAESYIQYRVGGKFDFAMRFMREFADGARRAGTATSVVWKYVLFGHNSSADELALAQRMAVEAGIREMRFVFTRNGPVAGRIRGAGDLPPAPEGLTVRFEQHEPNLGELEVRLKDGWTRLNGGDAEGAGELALAVARNLERFLPSAAEATPEHHRLLDELERLAQGLPSDVRAAVRGAVVHLGKK